MELTKNQIEAIRYQLKKNNLNASNDEIRLVSNDFSDFDAILIADKIIFNKSNSLSIKSDDLDNSMIDLYQKSELSKSEKNNLIKIKSQELGIDLNINEITQISDMVSEQINDSINFLNEVGIIISEFFTSRNNQVKDIVNQKVEDITTIINTKNNQLGDIFSSANQRLIDIASECNREKNDYKSTYQSKIESFKKILKL